MNSHLLTDVKKAVSLFGDIRKARKDGYEIELKKYRSVPVAHPDPAAGFYDTIEGCTLANCDRMTELKAREAFYTLPPETRHALSFAPKDGKFLERARIWKAILMPALGPERCSRAMVRIIQWYIHIKQSHKDAA